MVACVLQKASLVDHTVDPYVTDHHDALQVLVLSSLPYLDVVEVSSDVHQLLLVHLPSFAALLIDADLTAFEKVAHCASCSVVAY